MDNSHEIFEAKISVRSQCFSISKVKVLVKVFSADCPLILFKISNHYLHFGREEFCLVAGFRCGELSEYIWILESHPKSTLWWAKQQDVIPRGLAWSNFNRFQKTDYNLLFGQDSIPNLVLLPTSGELKADWWVRSQYYFKGEDAPFIQSVKPKCIDLQRCDSKVVDYVNAVEEDYTLVEQPKNQAAQPLIKSMRL
ncbi:hypothetical protein Tco_0006478 [Tanacetum coccineum]